MAPGAGPTSGEPEWPARLDVQRLLEEGWRPTPFTQFIVKIHSRCNLACSYCYMYEKADQSWRRQPRRMSRAIIDATAQRIAEHARSKGRTRVSLILHGGEPLLAGSDALRHAVTAVRDAVDPGVTVTAGLQTNGVLLDRGFLDLFKELDMHVCVSLDGDAEGHDRNRRGHDGQGSHERVVEGVRQLLQPRYRHLFTGLLSTIDLRNDPVATYEALLRSDPPSVDFMLPHATWDSPPPGYDPAGTPYGDWLIRVFDRWYDAPVSETRIPLFREIIRAIFGHVPRSEWIGLAPAAAVVVETDGSIEQIDTLKAAYDGAAGTALHVLSNSFDEVLMLPAIAARQIGPRALSDECRSCKVMKVCGGGLYSHRYRPGTGFANPSVYCRDLFKLISHIVDRMRQDLPGLRGRAGNRRVPET